MNKNLTIDEKTLYAMAQIYCQSNHSTQKGPHKICNKCETCIDYAIERTRKCPNEHKGNCQDCDIHCYKPEMRKQIKEIMSFSGPRMITRHPYMALRYIKRRFKRKDGNEQNN